MVATRRPRCRVEIEQARVDRRALLGSHVRSGGEATPYQCQFCLCTMFATSDHTPDWMRATCCGQVWHDSCLLRHVRTTMIDEEWACPNCKTTHTEDALECFDASDVIDRIFPEDTYEPPVDEDDADENRASHFPHTRSRGPPDPETRKLRSSRVY